MKDIKHIPFVFVLDYLAALEPIIKAWFGCYAVYIGEKLVLILRSKNTHTECNGVWIATSSQHHQSLKKQFPSLCSVTVLTKDNKETDWQMLPADADDFEPSVIRVCEFILHGDPRIGKIPKSKRKKNTVIKKRSKKL